MKYTCLFVLLLLSNVLAASEVKDVVQVKAQTENDNFLKGSKLFKSFKVIPLEKNNQSQMDLALTKIFSSDQMLFIFDKTKSQLVMFDFNGKYLNHIQPLQTASYYYESSSDFCLDTLNKRILLLCDLPQKLIYFNYQGEFIKEVKLNGFYTNIAVVGKSIYLSFCQGRRSGSLT